MAKRELHALALDLRSQGMSYTQIKNETGISKSTLSGWLREYPLPEERIRELRDTSEQRIERTRETKAKKREVRMQSVREKIENEIGEFSDRELFIAGLFLYWGEGSKTSHGTTSVSNTDPSVLRFFIKWLALFGISRDRLKVHLHLYADMDIAVETEFWSEQLEMSNSAFRKPYIKTSNRSGITYFQRFTHGTCNVLFENRDVFEQVSAGIMILRDRFALTCLA